MDQGVGQRSNAKNRVLTSMLPCFKVKGQGQGQRSIFWCAAVKVEKRNLVTELIVKMLNMQKVTFSRWRFLTLTPLFFNSDATFPIYAKNII